MAKKTNRSKQQRRSKASNWFLPVRGSYLPSSPAGWLTYIPFIGYLVISLAFAIRGTNSVGMAIIFIVPNWVAAAAVMTWIAARKS